MAAAGRSVRVSTGPPLPARATLMALIVAAHIAAILLLLLARSPPPGVKADSPLTVFDVTPPPETPPPSPTPPRPAPRALDPRPPGGSPQRAPAPPVDPRPPARFDTTITADAPPAPPTLAGDLIGAGIDLTPAGGNGRSRGHGTGTGDGDGAGGSTPATLVGADWLYKPVRELSYYWPRAKAARKASALVLLDCEMIRPGKPKRCAVFAERPVGLGFGEAAVGLSKHFRIRPVTRDGRTLTDVTIRVPVSFQTPGVMLPPPLSP